MQSGFLEDEDVPLADISKEFATFINAIQTTDQINSTYSL